MQNKKTVEMKNNKVVTYLKLCSVSGLIAFTFLLGGCSSDTTKNPQENVTEEKYTLWEIIDHEPDRKKLDAMNQDYVVVYAEIENGKPVMDNLLLRYEDGGTSIGDEYYIDEYRLECIGYKISACRYRKVDGKFVKEVMYEEADIERDHWVRVTPLRSEKE